MKQELTPEMEKMVELIKTAPECKGAIFTLCNIEGVDGKKELENLKELLEYYAIKAMQAVRKEAIEAAIKHIKQRGDCHLQCRKELSEALRSLLPNNNK